MKLFQYATNTVLSLYDVYHVKKRRTGDGEKVINWRAWVFEVFLVDMFFMFTVRSPWLSVFWRAQQHLAVLPCPQPQFGYWSEVFR